MIGDIKLHNAAADILQAVGLGMDDHVRCDRRGAGGRRAVAPLDLHQAEAAGTEGVDHVGSAEFRDLDARLHRGPHDRRAFRHGYGAAVDGECYLSFRAGCRRAVVDFMDERHDAPPCWKWAFLMSSW
ncbi:hypothetical protein D3C71_1430300 [compost metagenome]